MVGCVPALRMRQVNPVTGRAEVRLHMTGGTRLITFAGHHVSVSGGPRVALNPSRMVTRVAVAARFPDLRGSVTREAAVLPGFHRRRGVLGFVPALRVGHLQAVTGIAELLFLMTRRTRRVRIGETDPVAPGPARVDMVRWPRNHRQRVA